MILPPPWQEALTALRAGQCAIFPTDTVIGIGCALQHATAIDRLYEIKARPPSQATAVLVSDRAMLSSVAVLPDGHNVQALTDSFWPGGLTLVLPIEAESPYASTIGKIIGADLHIGVRVPDHPPLRALIEALGAPLVATSANFRGEPAPTKAAGIDPAFAALVEVVVAEDANGQQASSVVDLTQPRATLLREGAIPRAQLNTVWGSELA